MALILNGSDTSAGDDAGLGYTSAEGLILTGQGTTSDVTIKNDADATVLSIPTGTTKVGIGTTAAATKLHIIDSLSGGQLLVANSESDNAEKYGTFGTQHYDTDQEPVLAISAQSAASENNVLIGGALGEFNAATSIKFYTAANATTTTGTERMRIDSSGNVGIGTTSPSTPLHVNGAITVGQINAASGSKIYTAGSGTYELDIAGALSLTSGRDNGASMLFNVSGSQRMSITAAGTVIVASVVDAFRIGASSVGSVPVISESFDGSGRWLRNSNDTSSTDGARHQTFFHGGAEKGSITTSSSATTYGSASDYRLKENVNYSWDATTRLKQLKPARFNFIADADKTVDGFLAHEVSSVVPEAITGTKDGMKPEVLYVEGDELPDGKSVGDVKEASAPDYQNIDQSKLVPLLVKTIQELEARITALEAG